MTLPIDLPDVRRQIRMDANDDSRDAELTVWVEDAAAWVERETGHILVERDVTEHFRGCRPVDLRAWPIAASSTAAIAYDDEGDTAISGDARIDVSRRPARVLPATGTIWPFRDTQQPFSVTVRAGYEDPAAVPGNMRRSMLILITAYDEDREGGELFQAAEKTARRLCRSFRLRRL